ncbi:MAG: sugar-transfer associated ATP-grasp domain-containing protein [Coriobacteriales bacterium]
MSTFVKKAIKKAKLAVLWVRRILFAPSHFSTNPLTRLSLAVGGGYVPDQAKIYDFKHNSKREYLSEFDWYRSRWINEPFDQMLNNKIICTEVLQQYVSVPKLLAMRNKGRMVSLEKSRADGYLSNSDILELLKTHKVLFMKPLAAGKGKGVFRIECTDGALSVDGKAISRESFFAFLEKQGNWFLSVGMHQCAFLDQIYSKTTNTIRFITLRDPETGCYKVFFAVLRIGTSATIPVDNGSRGGLVSQIDLETGELSEARSLQALDVHEFHPDSGAPIKGAVIPGWGAIKEEMLALARNFPFMNFIAWDILLTEEGICIIEANTSSGVNIIQLWGPQRNGELGDFYRAHGVIK